MSRHRQIMQRAGRQKIGCRPPSVESLESRRLFSFAPLYTPVWTIRGDTVRGNTNDVISVNYNPVTKNMDATVDGVLVGSRPLAKVRALAILSGKGDDTITVDSGGKTIATTIDGGAGHNTIFTAKTRKLNIRGRHNSVVYGHRSAAPNVDLTTFAPDPSDPTSHPAVPISDSLRQRLIDEAVARYQHILGTDASNGGWYPWGPIAYLDGRGGAADGTTVANAGPPPGSSDHSTTNNQVQGVNEADLVQTDGNFIYTLSGNQLTIIDVRNPADAQVVSTTQLGGWGESLYLVGGRVVVLTNGDAVYPTEPDGGIGNAIRFMPIYYPQQTNAWVFDVSDATAPTLVERTTLSGNLADSRMIGSQLYLVMGNNVALPAPQILDDGNGGQRYQTEAEYRQWLSDNIDRQLPYYSTTLGDGSAGATGSLLDNFEYAPTGQPLDGVTTLVDIDVAADMPGPVAMTTAAGSPGTVYASQHNLYVFSTNYGVGSDWSHPTTDVLKFNLGTGEVQFDAVGHVNGTLLNSYSVDEYGGQLRVVTTEYVGNTGTQTHTLDVLTDTGTTLTVTGTLAHIGDGENLESVLFVQDRAYVVTFHQVDPLFAIDLSNPDQPVNVGELVVPGFSTYLYPLDHDHLIGIGRGQGSDPQNFHTLQISLYDVADLSHPVQVDQKLYDAGTNGWVGSDAQYDPHAFSYFAEQGVLAIPANTFNWSVPDGTENELIVLKVDPAAGFTELGQVVQNSEVRRSVRIGENLYSLAQGDLKIVKLSDPSQVIGDVILPAPAYRGPIYWSLPIATGGPIVAHPGGALTIQGGTPMTQGDGAVNVY